MAQVGKSLRILANGATLAITGDMPRTRTLAQFLREWLEHNDMTQRDLADGLEGVTDSRVSRWVTGHDIPAPRFRDDLAQRLGVTRAEVDRMAAKRDPLAVAKAELQTAERALQRARAALDD